jgi:3-hydroxyacyl-CoA dehydrogenase/enoyl-CoA hydratase/3-hydroxybutyryl-CoA epimerase
MGDFVTYEIRDGLAVVTLDAPGARINILNTDFLLDLERTAANLANEKNLTGAVVLSAKPGGFIAGADVGEIRDITDPAQAIEQARKGQKIFHRWSQLPFPVVAAIHGHCMGGGTEFALACSFRVVAHDAEISLPEVKLGIFPGFGGTQRLPRLISIMKALDLILKGRKVSAGEAVEIGLADRMSSTEALRHEAETLAREAALDPRHFQVARKRKRSGWKHLLLETNPLGRYLLFQQAQKKTREKTRDHYPAPLKALEVIRLGLKTSLEKGLEIEAREVGALIVSPVCKNLIHIFFLSQRPKKGSGLEAEPMPVRRAAVLGAGVMGAGIAQLFASRGIPVRLKDVSQEAVESGLARAREIFGRRSERAREEAGETEEKMKIITGSTTFEGFSEVDLVVEAVVEKLEVKQAVLREVEEKLLETAVFASNTSALSLTELQSVATRPGQVGGMHFFNPVHRMPLVEIIRGGRTSDRTSATLFDIVQKLGKTPILVADRPGFLVNRILVAYLNEACLLAGEGVSWRSVEEQATAFGLPMGPFRLIDEVGMDIAAEVGSQLVGAFPYLLESPLLGRAVEKNLLGKKAGKGFYLYEGGREQQANPEVDKLLELPSGRKAAHADWRRLLLLMVNEAGRCLEEKVVAAPEDVDTGMVFGTGFPPFRGGLCRWADSQGLPSLVAEIEKLAPTLGDRFRPSDYLTERKSFYPSPLPEKRGR